MLRSSARLRMLSGSQQNTNNVTVASNRWLRRIFRCSSRTLLEQLSWRNFKLFKIMNKTSQRICLLRYENQCAVSEPELFLCKHNLEHFFNFKEFITRWSRFSFPSLFSMKPDMREGMRNWKMKVKIPKRFLATPDQTSWHNSIFSTSDHWKTLTTIKLHQQF